MNTDTNGQVLHGPRTYRSQRERTEHIIRAQRAAKRAQYWAPPTPVSQAALKAAFAEREIKRQRTPPRRSRPTGSRRFPS